MYYLLYVLYSMYEVCTSTYIWPVREEKIGMYIRESRPTVSVSF
jgi:hypothetical protein